MLPANDDGTPRPPSSTDPGATRYKGMLPAPSLEPEGTRYPHTPDVPPPDPEGTRYAGAAALQADPGGTNYRPTDAEGTQYAQPGDAARHDRSLPRRFGNYELLERVGRGGMGAVYKARQLTTSRVVALKVVLAGPLALPGAVERFRVEARAAAQLDHPGIVPVYDIGEADGQPYFTMAFVPGGSLHELLRSGPLPPKSAAALVRQVAEAVQYAHERGIVHRDVKPHNILLQRSETSLGGTTVGETGGSSGSAASSNSTKSAAAAPTPRLTDFGLAKLADGQGLTVTGEQIGTPEYMPPEQAAGDLRRIGPHTDVYSLGAVLYCALTGRPPFQAANPMETLRQVRDQEPLPPRRLNPGVPQDLETVCLKCLEKDAARRYPSAGALTEDLRRFAAGEPLLARPVGALGRGWRWCRRNPTVATLAASVVVLFAVVAISAMIAAFAYRAKAAVEQQARVDLEEQLYDNSIAVAERELTLNQDVGLASGLLEKCPENLRGWEWNYLMRLRDGDRLPLGTPPPLGGRAPIKGTAGHGAGVWTALFSPDGRRVATGSIDGTVKVWDAASGRVLRTYRGHALLPISVAGIPAIPVMCLAFSPDGRHIASGSFSPNLGNLRDSAGVVKVWDVETGDDVVAFEEQVGPVLSLAYSPNGTRIASSSINDENTFVVWDANSAAVVQIVRGHTNSVHRLRYSPDGRLLVSCSADGSVKLWDAADFHEVRSIAAHPAPVLDVAFAPDGGRFVTAGQDGTVRVWDTATGAAALDPLRGHTGSALGVAFSPNGRRIASAGYDKTVRLWDAANGKLKLTLRGHTDMVWSADFSRDGRQLVSGSFDSTARVWDATPREEHVGPGLFTVVGHSDRVNSVAFSRDGRYLASGSWDNTVRLWDAQTGAALQTLEGHRGAVWCVAFSPDGNRLASASWDKTIKLWDTATGRELLTFTGHKAFAHCVAFSPDGRRVASGSLDAFVKIWDPKTGKVLVSCETGLFPASAVAFSPDGKRLASGSTDRTATLWDAETGKHLVTLKGHEGAIPSLCFSPDGKRLVTASWDYTLKVWDVDPGRQASLFQSRELLTLTGHTDQVNGVSYSPDGSRIASAGEDKTVRIWDAATGREVMPELRHRGVVWSVAYGRRGRRVAAGCWSADGWVKTWDVEDQSKRKP